MPVDIEKIRRIADQLADYDVEFGKGGKIHIKPSHRGRFSALLKRTGKTASWYKAHGTPAQKKMATFALNARKWKHADGGFLEEYDPDFVGPPAPRDPEGNIYDFAEMKRRQRYAESSFRDDLTSNRNAVGRYQITPIVYKEYQQKTGKTGNLMDPRFNEEVRDWYMNVGLDGYEVMRRGSPSEYNKILRGIASYNAGPVAVSKALARAEAAGVDINNSTDWISYLTKETRDYVNFVGRKQDVAGTSKTMKDYESAMKRHNIMSYGGDVNLYPGGGKVVSEVWKERTGLDWADVGKYYTDYDRTQQGNLRLLDELNAGKYDYLKSGVAPQQNTDIMPVSFRSPDQLSKNQVKETQQFLQSHGYNIGPTGVDGIFGKNTTRAYQQYLMDSGISVGEAGADSKFGKNTERASAALAMKNNDILLRQAPLQTDGASTVTAPAVNENKTLPVQQPANTPTVSVNNTSLENAFSAIDNGKYDEIAAEDIGKGKGLSNFGQLYNSKYDDFVTDSGLNLSNIHVDDDKLMTPGEVTKRYSGGMQFNDLKHAADTAKRVTKDGEVKQCSAFVQYAAADAYGWDYKKTNGMSGDAWMIGDNMVRHGGKRYFDVFSGTDGDDTPWMTYIRGVYGLDDNKKLYAMDDQGDKAKAVGEKMFGWVKQNYEKNKDKYKEQILGSVKEGDIVELMYKGSSHSIESMKDSKGSRPSTHLGYICKIGDEFYIQDNTSGTVHNRKLSDVLDAKDGFVMVAGLVRPKTSLGSKDFDVSKSGRAGTDLGDFGVYRNEDGKTRYYRLDNDTAYRALGSLYNNREVLADQLKLTPEEYNLLSGVVHCIGYKETMNGEMADNSKVLDKKGQTLLKQYGDEVDSNINNVKSAAISAMLGIGGAANRLTGGLLAEFEPSVEPSIGTTQLKYNGKDSLLTDAQRDSLGEAGHQAMLDVQPETSAVATMYAVANNYKILMDAFDRYSVPEEYRSPLFIVGLLGKMYNEGASIVVQSLANANAAAGSDTESREKVFADKFDKMKSSYMSGMMSLFPYHDYRLFSSEDIDAYNEKAETQRNQSIDAILAAVEADDSILPNIYTLIRNMSVKDAKRYGATAALDAEKAEAYKRCALDIEADTKKDRRAANAYKKAFKKQLKSTE